MSETIGIIGLGTISNYHVRALEQIDRIDVIAGVDTDPDRTLIVKGDAKPVYDSIEQLLDKSPSIVIVATPTPTHYEVAKRILSYPQPPARIIIEKPMGTSLAQVEELVGSSGDISIDGIYHAAHAPEVLWAVERWDEWSRSFGKIVRFESFFSDPYRDSAYTGPQISHINSWLDSGINALSVDHRFVDLTSVGELRTLDESRSVYEADLNFKSGNAEGVGTIRTSWDVSAAEKHSEFTWESGVSLYLHHQGISASVRRGDEVLDQYSYTGEIRRLQLHYINAFKSLLVDRSGYYQAEASLHLHRLLFSC
jgi:D-galactose 1-dehydrogenase